MKYIFFSLWLLFPAIHFAQIANPVSNQSFSNWHGDTSLFVFENQWIRANDYDTSTSLPIWTTIPNINNTEWKTEIKLDFNPSSTNHLLFYLLADQPINQSNVHGYYLKFGGASGNADAIDLYKQQGNTHTKILSGKTGYIGQELIHVQVKVQYYENGTWRLYADSTASSNFIFQGEVIEKTPFTEGFAGFKYIHTSTRKDKFSFNNITHQSAPAAVISVSAVSVNKLSITLSSEDLPSFPQNSIQINGAPADTIIQTGKLLDVTTTEELKEGENSISINLSNLNYSSTFIFNAEIESSSLIIHEIMADPSPSFGLPEYEYIELLNKGFKPINIINFSFSDKTTTAYITENITIQPDSFLILCSSEAAEYYSLLGNTYGLKTWPSLNNDTDYLQLKDNKGILIDEIEFNKSWHSSASKSDGGYSLEMINAQSLCKGKNNWASSESSNGGTPGKANAVSHFQKNETLLLLSYQISTDSIILIFDREISWPQKAVITFDNFPISNYEIATNTIVFSAPYLLSPNSIYQIIFSEQINCEGQPLPEQSFELVFPAVAKAGDILLNEILFNPKTGGAEFLELYNNSENIIDLSILKLAYRKTPQDSLNYYNISDKVKLIHPKEFRVLTKDTALITALHPNAIKETLVQLGKFPSLNDDEGEIQIVYKENILDNFWYNSSHHNPTISDQNGVSLERISYTTATTEKSNWHSASSTAGFATPGYKNSQAENLSETDKVFHIEPPVFTPDGDGYQDLAFFRYKLPQEGWLASISIFDIQGRLINKIANNQLLGTEGFLTWDGTNTQGNLANIGMYLLLVELFQQDGETKKYKETVVLGASR